MAGEAEILALTVVQDREIINDLVRAEAAILPPHISVGITLDVPCLTAEAEIVDIYAWYCSAPTITRLGRTPIGVNQPPGGGDDYPLIAPSSDIEKLFADLCLEYRDDAGLYVQPFHIVQANGFGCERPEDYDGLPPRPDLVIEDNNGEVVVDTRSYEDFEETTWTDRFDIFTWRNADVSLSAAVFTTWRSAESDRTYSAIITPERAVIDPRAIRHAPARLDSISIDASTYQGYPVRLVGGYNCAVTLGPSVTSSAGRKYNPITFDTAPGLGDGRYLPPCDNELRTLRSINGVYPDAAGNLLIEPTACIRISSQPYWYGSVTLIHSGVLSVDNDCGLCNNCNNYAAVYEAIRRQSERLAILAEKFVVLRDNYVANAQRFAALGSCEQNNALRLVLQPECPSMLAIAAGYCNQSDECLQNVVLHISFEYEPSEECVQGATTTTFEETPEVVCNTTVQTGNVLPGAGRGGSNARAHTRQSYYTLGGKLSTLLGLFRADTAARAGLSILAHEFSRGYRARSC